MDSLLKFRKMRWYKDKSAAFTRLSPSVSNPKTTTVLPKQRRCSLNQWLSYFPTHWGSLSKALMGHFYCQVVEICWWGTVKRHHRKHLARLTFFQLQLLFRQDERTCQVGSEVAGVVSNSTTFSFACLPCARSASWGTAMFSTCT